MIFFDDYSLVLIAGTSLRTVMFLHVHSIKSRMLKSSIECVYAIFSGMSCGNFHCCCLYNCVCIFVQMMKTADVSKQKFAYILKSLGPTLPSLIPISR